MRLREADIALAQRNIGWILANPAFSEWLKEALRTAMVREPLDVANDMEILRHLLHNWTMALLERDQLITACSGEGTTGGLP